jgi:hypothetical protein
MSLPFLFSLYGYVWIILAICSILFSQFAIIYNLNILDYIKINLNHLQIYINFFNLLFYFLILLFICSIHLISYLYLLKIYLDLSTILFKPVFSYILIAFFIVLSSPISVFILYLPFYSVPHYYILLLFN